MMVAMLAAGLLLVISLVHIYWAAGGRGGLRYSLPSVGGDPAFRPGRLATLAVAGILLLAAAILLARTGVAGLLPHWLSLWGSWIWAGIFLLRSIGDGRLMGLFKKERDSDFARWDTRVYVPLCLFFSFAFTWVSLR